MRSDLLRTEGGRPVLVGGWSPTSRQWHFPLAERCPYSGADDVEARDLPTTGVLWLWTTVTAPPPGYHGPVPYDLGVVELDCQPTLRLVTRLGGETREVGAPAVLRTETLPDGAGGELVIWAFEVGSQ